MLIPLIVVGLLASSTLSMSVSNDHQPLIKSEVETLTNENLRAQETIDYKDTLRSFKDLPLPRLTKNLEPSEWFDVIEQLTHSTDFFYYPKTFLYYVDPEVIECNLAALKLPYNEMKKSFKKCN